MPSLALPPAFAHPSLAGIIPPCTCPRACTVVVALSATTHIYSGVSRRVVKGRPGLAAGAQRLRVRLTAAVQACTAGGSSAQLVRAGENRARMFLVAMLNMRGGAGVCIPPPLAGPVPHSRRSRFSLRSTSEWPRSSFPRTSLAGGSQKEAHAQRTCVHALCVLCASTCYTTNLLVIVLNG